MGRKQAQKARRAAEIQSNRNQTSVQNRLPPSAPSTHKIIVGIDYGTTYSGVSYVTTNKKHLEDIRIISNWPGELSTADKTPTRIAYAKENDKDERFGTQNKWGFSVDSKDISYSWTKLLLDKHAAVGKFDDPSLAGLKAEGLMQLPKGKTAQEVCQDFLTGIYEHLVMKLQQEISVATFDKTPMECWITLPAIWSDAAKDATLKAAKAAGFGSRVCDEVYTIAEPEAAAIATLKKYSDVDTINAVKVDEHILVCDCGGGTVDITTYTIAEVTPTLAFDELCVGVGGKCGSTYIDRNLHKLLSDRFGKNFDELSQVQKGPGSQFMKNFEIQKRMFDGINRGIIEIGPLNLKLPASDSFDPETREIRLSHEDMLAVFDPVIQEIINLVDQQVTEVREKKKAAINRIILVGGFGASTYLFTKLHEWCSTHGQIQLMCPDKPQAAVVRGAALRGLQPSAPRQKKSRRHYGYSCHIEFREGIDPEQYGYIDQFSGRKYCKDRMCWSINKGDPIVHDTFRSFELHCEHAVGKPFFQTVEFYSSSAEVPPDDENDPELELVGTIVAQLPADFVYGKALVSRFNHVTRQTVFNVKVDIQVVYGNKGDNLTYRTAVNGEPVGTALINFTSVA